jgi:hypothetical protein
LSTPGKTLKCPNAVVNDSDEQVIKDITECKYNFEWKVTSLRQILKEMEFNWKRCEHRRTILNERKKTMNWRCAYLK